jgi:hypothetical protein
MNCKRLLPNLRVTAFGPGHHFLAEERPERDVELVTQTIHEDASAASRRPVVA